MVSGRFRYMCVHALHLASIWGLRFAELDRGRMAIGPNLNGLNGLVEIKICNNSIVSHRNK